MSAADWDELTPRVKEPFFYYRKIPVYKEMKWVSESINFTDDIARICAYGGPVAILRNSDSSRDGVISGGDSNKSLISIYSSCGTRICQFYIKEAKIVDFNWTADFKLCLVGEEGNFYMFDCFGNNILVNDDGVSMNEPLQFKLNKNEKIVNVRFWDEGVAVFTSEYRLLVVEDLIHFRATKPSKGTKKENESKIGKPTHVVGNANEISSEQLEEDQKRGSIQDKDATKQDKILSIENEEAEEEFLFYEQYEVPLNTEVVECMEVIPAKFFKQEKNVRNHPQVLFSSRNYDTDSNFKSRHIICSGPDGFQTFRTQINIDFDISHIQLSPKGSVVAVFAHSEKGKKYARSRDINSMTCKSLACVYKSDFSEEVLHYCIKEQIPDLKQLCFCEELGFVLYWEPSSSSFENEMSDNISVSSFNDIALPDSSSILMLINSSGNSKIYVMDGPLSVKQELDCCRIYTNYSCEILERVDKSLVSIFQIGSFSAGALLFDAYKEFKSERATAIQTLETIREIVDESNQTRESIKSVSPKDKTKEQGVAANMGNFINSMKKAIEQCITAACHEYDIESQQTLLRAAAFGNVFLTKVKLDDPQQSAKGLEPPTEDYLSTQLSKEFQSKVDLLKIINQLRSPEYGFFVTYKQFQTLSIPVLTQRLNELHFYFLSFKIAKSLNLKNQMDQTLYHWACSKIIDFAMRTNQMNSNYIDSAVEVEKKNKFEVERQKQLAQQIISKLESEKADGSLYPRIAMTAFKAGQKTVAIRFLSCKEAKKAETIPLYLNMHETTSALRKAKKSADPDLMYLIVLYMMERFEQSYMYGILKKDPQIVDIFVSFATKTDIENAKLFYKYLNDYRNLGMSLLLEAYCPRVQKHKFLRQQSFFLDRLISAEESFKKDNEHVMSKLDESLTRGQIRLLKLQHKLEETLKSKKQEHEKNSKKLQKKKDEKKSFLSSLNPLKRKKEEEKELLGGNASNNQPDVSYSFPETIKGTFLGKSLHQTIELCVLYDMEEKAVKLCEKFDVNEKRYWMIVVEAYGKLRSWKKLYEFSRIPVMKEKGVHRVEHTPDGVAQSGGLFSFFSKKSANVKTFNSLKSPIGYEPFVEVCKQNNMRLEALKYIPFVEDAEQKIHYYVYYKRFEEAIVVAGKEVRSVELLEYVLSQSKNQRTQKTIKSVIAQLKGIKNEDLLDSLDVDDE